MRVTIDPERDVYRVSQGEIAVSSNAELRTSALFTCSGLIVVGGGKRLLAHCDASSAPQIIAQTIQDNFDISDPSLRVEEVKGASDNIAQALVMLGLEQKCIISNLSAPTNMIDLVVSQDGYVFVEENDLAKMQNFTASSGLQMTFITNAAGARVRDLGGGLIEYTMSVRGKPKAKVYKNAEIGPQLGGLSSDVGIYQALD